ncbi:hypothetical protein ZTR_09722 [Talaromyces verruculosus]|nr:hypothetical protein ZTR_09722 [Talaromyces verruculosus]
MFIKPSHSLASFNEDIPIPRIVQHPEQLDCEGELPVVIGKTGKNIPEAQALEYVAGYAVSNDISSRSDPAYAGVVLQWCFSKGFDKFCPIGLMLVSPKVVGAADNLQFQTRLNGGERQNSNTNDMIFGVKMIIAFLGRGQTLEKGTVILTGTPDGVALGMPNPIYLKDGYGDDRGVEYRR